MSQNFTPRSLVGMTQGARKRRAREWMECERLHQRAQDLQEVVDRQMGRRSQPRTVGHTPGRLKQYYRIGQKLRPCPGCPECDHGKHWRCGNCGTENGICDLILAEVRCKCGKGCGQWRISYPAKTVCDGSGVLPAKRQLCLGCSWCGTPPKEGATRFTECDGSGVLPARRA